MSNEWTDKPLERGPHWLAEWWPSLMSQIADGSWIRGNFYIRVVDVIEINRNGNVWANIFDSSHSDSFNVTSKELKWMKIDKPIQPERPK